MINVKPGPPLALVRLHDLRLTTPLVISGDMIERHCPAINLGVIRTRPDVLAGRVNYNPSFLGRLPNGSIDGVDVRPVQPPSRRTPVTSSVSPFPQSEEELPLLVQHQHGSAHSYIIWL